MATTDIRFKRMQREYESLHDTQDETLDKVDGLEAAILGLNQTVVANHEFTQREFTDIRRDISALNDKMDAIIKHLDVPYKPVGFIKE